MLVAFWFQTNSGLGYGVTARDRGDADALLRRFGYPSAGQQIVSVISGVSVSQLDERHVLPNAGPLAIRGVWYPRHNV
jgi:hypothetical protein